MTMIMMIHESSRQNSLSELLNNRKTNNRTIAIPTAAPSLNWWASSSGTQSKRGGAPCPYASVCWWPLNATVSCFSYLLSFNGSGRCTGLAVESRLARGRSPEVSPFQALSKGGGSWRAIYVGRHSCPSFSPFWRYLYPAQSGIIPAIGSVHTVVHLVRRWGRFENVSKEKLVFHAYPTLNIWRLIYYEDLINTSHRQEVMTSQRLARILIIFCYCYVYFKHKLVQRLVSVVQQQKHWIRLERGVGHSVFILVNLLFTPHIIVLVILQHNWRRWRKWLAEVTWTSGDG